MMIAGTLASESCKSIGGFLFWGLLGFIGVELLNNFVLHLPMKWFNYAGAVIFSLFIAHDWAKAITSERTLADAIDAAVGLYMDIINLFIRILAGSKSD